VGENCVQVGGDHHRRAGRPPRAAGVDVAELIGSDIAQAKAGEALMHKLASLGLIKGGRGNLLHCDSRRKHRFVVGDLGKCLLDGRIGLPALYIHNMLSALL
jgi:hypothetical protein